MRKIAIVIAALMVAPSMIVVSSPAFAGTYTTTVNQKCSPMTNATQKKQCVATAQKNKTVALKQCNAMSDATKKKACVARAS
jgi:hypothetical protein